MGVHIVTFVNICTVFFISGLTLRTQELWQAFSRTAATDERTQHSTAGSTGARCTVFGMLSIIGITPLLGFAVRLLPLAPPEYVAGLTIFTLVPTTLGVCVSLAQSAKGNVGLAIFLTVASNVVGVISSLCRSLAFIIWQTLSSAREYIVNSSFGAMLLVFVSALLIHVIYLVFNAVAVKLLRVPVPEAISTIIMASQKSAPVAVTAIAYITTDPVAQGLLAVPAVTGQLLQIFIGQPLAHFMEGKAVAWQQAQTKLQLPVVAPGDELVVNAGVQGEAQLKDSSVPQ
ncbi:hypothetical protein OEZ86_002156 [Tetradesmus obliquus]|nr:hypothetical protein OEZ86_002156 [Tetradesmus obliquus]